jgi:hypothetical protein
MGSLTLSKDALREKMTTWLIKCPGEGNLNDVEHFNKLHALRSFRCQINRLNCKTFFELNL